MKQKKFGEGSLYENGGTVVRGMSSIEFACAEYCNAVSKLYTCSVNTEDTWINENEVMCYADKGTSRNSVEFANACIERYGIHEFAAVVTPIKSSEELQFEFDARGFDTTSLEL